MYAYYIGVDVAVSDQRPKETDYIVVGAIPEKPNDGLAYIGAIQDGALVWVPCPVTNRSPMEQIALLKAELTTTDYQVIKCSEYQLAGLEPPYDIAELHARRQALRDRINELEAAIA